MDSGFSPASQASVWRWSSLELIVIHKTMAAYSNLGQKFKSEKNKVCFLNLGIYESKTALPNKVTFTCSGSHEDATLQNNLSHYTYSVIIDAGVGFISFSAFTLIVILIVLLFNPFSPATLCIHGLLFVSISIIRKS